MKNNILRLILITLFLILPLRSVFSSVPGSLPAPTHPIMFGYYHVLAQYGDFLDEVSNYTNTDLIGAGSWIRGTPDCMRDTASLDSAFRRSIAAGHIIVYSPITPVVSSCPDGQSESDIAMNIANKYWDDVSMIYFADEPGWDKATTENNISSFKNSLTQKGLTQKKIAINYTNQQIMTGNSFQASNLDVVGFEAYMDPSLQNDPDLVKKLNSQIDQLKQKIGNKKMFIVVQAYDRNGTWTNLNSLVDIQTPPYLKAYSDNNVIGLFLFTYARPGGTRDNSILKEAHMLMGKTILGTAGSSQSDPTVATPGWFGDLAFDTKDNKWLVISMGGPIVGRFLSSDSTPITAVFKISPDSHDGTYAPSVAYSSDDNKFLVVWDSFPNPNGPLGVYGIFVNPDGTTGNAFIINVNGAGSLNQGSDKTSVLKYDSKNKRFVLIWQVPGGGPRFTTITSSGVIGPTVDLFTGTGGGNWSPKIAVNEDKNEYCAVYDQRNSGKWAVRQVNAANLSPGIESVVPMLTIRTDIAYNSSSKKYLVVYNNANSGTSGRFLNSCDANDTDSGDFSILEGASYARVAANPISGTFAVIGQDGFDRESKYVVLDSDGQILSSDTITTNAVNGQYVQMIAANTNDGSYAVMTDRDYAETFIVTGVGAGLTGGGGGSAPGFSTPPNPTIPTQGLPTDLGQLISQIFTWSLSILGIAVFVMFFYSGFLWLTAAGNTSKIGEARTHMTNAVFGAILLLSSYLILYTINPDFVKSTVNLPGLGTTTTPTPSTGGECTIPPPATGPSHDAIVKSWRSKYPATMDANQIVEMLQGVAADVTKSGDPDGPFGIAQKPGSPCNNYSCDIICSDQGDQQRQWDVIGSSGPGEANNPVGWSFVSCIAIRKCEIK